MCIFKNNKPLIVLFSSTLFIFPTYYSRDDVRLAFLIFWSVTLPWSVTLVPSTYSGIPFGSLVCSYLIFNICLCIPVLFIHWVTMHACFPGVSAYVHAGRSFTLGYLFSSALSATYRRPVQPSCRLEWKRRGFYMFPA